MWEGEGSGCSKQLPAFVCHLEAQLWCILEPTENAIFWLMGNKPVCDGPAGSAMPTETGVQTGPVKARDAAPGHGGKSTLGFLEAVACQSTF